MSKAVDAVKSIANDAWAGAKTVTWPEVCAAYDAAHREECHNEPAFEPLPPQKWEKGATVKIVAFPCNNCQMLTDRRGQTAILDGPIWHGKWACLTTDDSWYTVCPKCAHIVAPPKAEGEQKPRRMRAESRCADKPGWCLHAEEHDEGAGCDVFPACVPVDAPKVDGVRDAPTEPHERPAPQPALPIQVGDIYESRDDDFVGTVLATRRRNGCSEVLFDAGGIWHGVAFPFRRPPLREWDVVLYLGLPRVVHRSNTVTGWWSLGTWHGSDIELQALHQRDEIVRVFEAKDVEK